MELDRWALHVWPSEYRTIHLASIGIIHIDGNMLHVEWHVWIVEGTHSCNKWENSQIYSANNKYWPRKITKTKQHRTPCEWCRFWCWRTNDDPISIVNTLSVLRLGDDIEREKDELERNTINGNMVAVPIRVWLGFYLFSIIAFASLQPI